MISAVFDSGDPTGSQNGLDIIKNFLWGLWIPLGVFRKKFDYAIRNKINLGVQKFLSNPFWTLFDQKKKLLFVFDHFFEFVQGRALDG